MQQSMTGYGRNERVSQHFLIRAEIRTLNSKFLDFLPRYPKELVSKEVELKNMVTTFLKRGKIMFTLDLQVIGDDFRTVQIDERLFKTYYEKFKSLSETVDGSTSDLVRLAIQAPEVIKQQELSSDKLPWEDIKKTVSSAIQDCISFRIKEGEVLIGKLSEYITNIDDGLKIVTLADESRADNVRNRLQKELDEIKGKVQVDENRFEQELIFYLERLNISEEKVRLKQHLNYFDEVMTKEKDSGKKLGFIAQEIGREINTISSKANDSKIQRTVVTMKDELEKIKEQILNLL